MKDFLIVGQGLAGTLLAHFLLKEGKNVYVIDNQHHEAASQVAAGIINPVTGRRMVKSWRFDEFLAHAKTTYPALEKELNIKFFHPRNVLRSISNVRQENEWLSRCRMPDVVNYLLEEVETDGYEKIIKPVFSWGELQQSAQVNIPILINAFREKLRKEGRLLEEKFDFNQLILLEEKVQYQQITAKKVLFCEGAQSINNPYFKYLPHEPAKGEVLIIRIPGFNAQKIAKLKVFLVPLGDEKFWVGSTYAWDFKDGSATKEGREDLIQRLNKTLNVPYEIIDQKAAVRPVFKDRRPMIGLHPQHPTLGIFNGLGTKGASLAPFWAHHFTQVLTQKQEIDPETNVGRIRG